MVTVLISRNTFLDAVTFDDVYSRRWPRSCSCPPLGTANANLRDAVYNKDGVSTLAGPVSGMTLSRLGNRADVFSGLDTQEPSSGLSPDGLGGFGFMCEEELYPKAHETLFATQIVGRVQTLESVRTLPSSKKSAPSPLIDSSIPYVPSLPGNPLDSTASDFVHTEVAVTSDDQSLETQLPSKGSESHLQGLCKPCRWFSMGACRNGSDCGHCHFGLHRPKKKHGKNQDWWCRHCIAKQYGRKTQCGLCGRPKP